MAFSEFALADGASLDSGLPGAGGGSMGEDEQILQVIKRISICIISSNRGGAHDRVSCPQYLLTPPTPTARPHCASNHPGNLPENSRDL